MISQISIQHSATSKTFAMPNGVSGLCANVRALIPGAPTADRGKGNFVGSAWSPPD